MMISRRLLVVAAGSTLASPRLAVAQAGAAPRRIAYVGATSAATEERMRAVIGAAMNELGWVEGRNLIVESRYAEGDAARISPLAAELLALKPDLFVTNGDREARVIVSLTRTVPIVFLSGIDPVGLGVVQSLARPGGNVTGMSVLGDELTPKRLSLLKEAIPGLDKIGALYRAGDPRSGAVLATLEGASRQLGVTIVPAPVQGTSDIEAAFDALAQAGARAVIHLSSTLFFLRRQQLAELALKHRMASAFSGVQYAEAGALMSYGPDYNAVVRRGAALIDRVLRGADPATIPVEQVNVYELAINRQTARSLGLELPRSLMLQVTRVIE